MKIQQYCGIKEYKQVLDSRLDIIIKKQERICLLIDVSIPSDRNIIQKDV